MDDLNKGINLEEGLNRLKGNKILYKRLLDSFFNGNMLDMLNESVKNNDVKSARMHAHSIKGAAANLALNQISETAAIIDNMLKAENASITLECLDQIGKLETLTAATKEKLNGQEL